VVNNVNKEIINILKTLEKNNFKAYIVGGFVRDYFLGIDTFDVDITTDARPNELIKIFPTAKLDKNYGSIKIQIKNFNFDITTLREEVYECDKIKINYISDLEIDSLRRDFTINAIYMDRHLNVFDPQNGLIDLKNNVLKIIGNPNIRFIEDPLRILRTIRFITELNLDIDDETKNAIEKNKKLLSKISHFKKKEELNKIFVKDTKLKGLELIKQYKLEKHLELNYDNVSYTTSPLGIWAQIKFSEKYPFTKQELKIIESIRECKEINNEYIYKHGLLISLIATEIKGINKKEVNNLYKNLPIKSQKDIKINYKKIINLGYKEKEINDIIKSLEIKILNKTLKNNPLAIIKELKQRK